MKTRNIFIFFILFGTVTTLTACNKTIFSNTNNPTALDNSAQDNIIPPADDTMVETDSIIIDGNKIKPGQTFFINSTFAPEPYKLIFDEINSDNSIEISYSEIYLGSPCSSSKNISSLIVSSNEKCLSSTTCDAGEKVCFKINKKNKNIILEYTISKYDSGI